MQNRYKFSLFGIPVIVLLAAVGFTTIKTTKLRKEVSAISSAYQQTEAALAEKTEALSLTETQLAEKTEALSLTEAQLAEADERKSQHQERIANLQRSLRTALVNLPPQTSESCLDEDLFITGSQLGNRVDSKKKRIAHDKLVELAGRQGEWTVSGVYFNTESLSDDANTMSRLEFRNESNVTEIVNGPDEPARAFDFIAQLKGPNGDHCHILLRLHFAEPASTLDKSGWSIVSIIGRSGLGIGRFSLPYGTQFYDGNLWTTDCSNENVSVYTLKGQFRGSFGEFGTRLGKLDTPAALAIFDDRIYVTEERNHRVQVFDMEGKTIDIIGSYKATDDPMMFKDKFNSPLGIAWNGKHLAVVDYGNNRIIGLDPAKGYRAEWVSGNSPEDENIKWEGPYYIRWSAKGGYFVVANRGANELVIIGPKGEKIRSIGRDFLNYPHEVDVDEQGNIYVADMKNHRVVIFSAADDFSEETARVINFPESYGLPKTMTVLPDSRISVGFVGNGSAYFLVLAENSKQSNVDDISLTTSAFDQGILFSEPSGPDEQPSAGTPPLKTQAREVYSNFCSACHENGDYGAPTRGNIEAWERFPRDLDALFALALVGKGAMVPRGGCDECSAEVLKETIKLMVPMTWYQTGFLSSEE